MRPIRWLLLPLLGGAMLHAAGGFEPLERWKEAVLAGDPARLRGYYDAGSAALLQTPEGKTADLAGEEVKFWSGLARRGLTEFNPKVLEEWPDGPDSKRVLLRIEMTFHSEKQLLSAQQTWALRNGEWRILQVTRGTLRAMPVITLPQPRSPNPNLYPAPEEAQGELKAALAAAQADHKRVLVIFGANWCYDCHVLDATLRSATVAPLVEANYHVLHINIGDDGKQNEDLAARFQVALDKGIPSLAVLDGDGKVITSQRNGEFESAAKIGLRDVTGFLERWKPPGA
jgi:thioredoxin 1